MKIEITTEEYEALKNVAAAARMTNEVASKLCFKKAKREDWEWNMQDLGLRVLTPALLRLSKAQKP